ncbi:MAG: hypothetical protein GX146_09330 [Myxococcales bacterium]|jgi:hypothetical protein|nr:hypothetical protein [Myxococcales bacterium]
MYRLIAFLLAAAIGALAGWQVFVNFKQIHMDFFVTLGATAGVGLVVTLLFYLPLFRHIADAIHDHFSTIHARLTAKKAGLGFDHIPERGPAQRRTGSRIKSPCGICGGPGGPVCEKCRVRMSRI